MPKTSMDIPSEIYAQLEKLQKEMNTNYFKDAWLYAVKSGLTIIRNPILKELIEMRQYTCWEYDYVHHDRSKQLPQSISEFPCIENPNYNCNIAHKGEEFDCILNRLKEWRKILAENISKLF